MLKTNSKEVKVKVRQYILDSIEDDYLIESGYSVATDKDKLQGVYDCMCAEWWNPYERKRTPNKYDALREYAQCLPSVFNIEHSYYGQRQLLKDWLQQADAESDKYHDDEMCKLFYYLISREFYSMLDKIK